MGCLCKSFQEKSYKWDVFAGISMGAALLTKAIGAFFLPAVGALALYKVYKKDIKQIPKKIVFAAVTTVLVLPWLIRNAGINGTTTSAISGYHGIYKYAFTSQTTMAMFTWIGLYAGFILLSTGVIFAAG
ncbi:phospholipid carrier-dependent glycosyltransferase, partial [Candidatus Woesearchaeota archaeon]|nr:phospholipid carrier-dependent glycosyltransferase [Candidatus Woesearchaeota archaeon]